MYKKTGYQHLTLGHFIIGIKRDYHTLLAAPGKSKLTRIKIDQVSKYYRHFSFLFTSSVFGGDAMLKWK